MLAFLSMSLSWLFQVLLFRGFVGICFVLSLANSFLNVLTRLYRGLPYKESRACAPLKKESRAGAWAYKALGGQERASLSALEICM